MNSSITRIGLHAEDLTRFPGDHVVLHADGRVEYFDELTRGDNHRGRDWSDTGESGRNNYGGPRYTDTWEFWVRQAGYANLKVAARQLGCTERQAAMRCGELYRARRQRVAA